MGVKVTIVGVGALGSHLVQFIRNLPAEFTAIDFDRIESKNVLAQFHGKPSVGKLKVEALKQTMAFLYGLKLTAIPHRLTKDNTQALLSDVGLVVDCLDNGESRRLVQGFVRDRKIPCLHGALAPDGSFGRVIWESQGFVIDDENVAGAVTCEGGDHLPFIAVVAAYMARAVQEFLRGGKKIGFSITPGGVFVI
jgi:molybdopterin/thiamine biosynthesis adenylyltransferase